jgi:tetrapyrrole methylase family protein/MazG family protein
MSAGEKLEKLVGLVKTLRGKDGCPWHKAQTFETISEEARNEIAELFEALEEKDDDHIKEELGDAIWELVVLATIADEQGRFDLEGALDGIAAKVIRRHPHVFGDKKAATVEEALKLYYEAKAAEKKVKR